ncbi:MAG: hypothetical protein K6F53_13075 [Lachnospiraceae bacterium]|nr:hypothetical protein [Lachnospiraceae bacterium]
MSDGIQMSVSSMTRTDQKKAVYVLFRDGEKTAEFALPECELIKNSGFSEEELGKLREYTDGDRDRIFELARGVDPMKAFLGK